MSFPRPRYKKVRGDIVAVENQMISLVTSRYERYGAMYTYVSNREKTEHYVIEFYQLSDVWKGDKKITFEQVSFFLSF